MYPYACVCGTRHACEQLSTCTCVCMCGGGSACTPQTTDTDRYRCTIRNAPARAQGNRTQALLLCYCAAVFGVCPVSGTFCFHGRGQDTKDAEFAYTQTHTPSHTYRSRMPDTPMWVGGWVGGRVGRWVAGVCTCYIHITLYSEVDTYIAHVHGKR